MFWLVFLCIVLYAISRLVKVPEDLVSHLVKFRGGALPTLGGVLCTGVVPGWFVPAGGSLALTGV